MKKSKIISAKKAITPFGKMMEKEGIKVHETVMNVDDFVDAMNYEKDMVKIAERLLKVALEAEIETMDALLDKIKEPKVTEKEIFDFHNNLMTISEEEYDDSEKLWERERRYIKSWLESKGVRVEK